MLMFYKAYERGKTDYESVVHDAASNNKKKKKRKGGGGLRIIVGTGRSTAKEVIEVSLAITPLNIQRNQLTLSYY